ncbi:PREDICTED: uncharacterized protein LOC109158036 [Ipomoea nil]|uniref:uncharacterized protein LOC109158036 n=1 Tax=Ipomoea nil TaxID=35883 RepID=UPI00090094E5|nr:PREDICTED: uncharacterized protein LOC109158036 [Ipomoea nil]
MRVSELIDPITKDWDVGKLTRCFMERDVGLIRKIPVAPTFTDSWCWRDDTNGQYQVRHGYKLMVSVQDSGHPVSFAWKDLWRLKIPPNILNFVWRCIHGVLPTMVTLASRRVDVDTMCHLCKQHPETLRHLFLDCIHVQALWDSAPLMQIASDDDFVDCFSKWLAMADGQIVKSCIAACWIIWKHSNALVWNSKVWLLSSLKHDITHTLIAWEEGLEHAVPPLSAMTTVDSHLCEEQGTVCIFVDASVFHDSGDGFFRAIIKDNAGAYLAAKNGPLRCIGDAFLGEAMTVKEALSWAKERGDNKVIIYSDCQIVCRWFSGMTRDLS